MAPIPIALISDAVSSSTGLARITRELAQRIHANLSETFEVCTIGHGGTVSSQYPWRQYPVSRMPDWTIPELPFIASDFFRDRKGICFWVQNASWLPWVAMPEKLPDGDLKTFLQSGQVEHWIYAPIDAEGPNGNLVSSQGEILAKFDRVLAYTKWAAELIERTISPVSPNVALSSNMKKLMGVGEIPYLPHGCDDTIFHPRSRKEARSCFIEKVVQKGQGIVSDDVLLIGGIATNTNRKNWGLFFEVCGELLKRGVNIGAWVHSDSFQKGNCWDLLTLSESFGMKQRTIFTNSHLDDDALSWGMAASDVVLGIGDGEGWGLVNSSALACGIPCLTGDYAGAAEFTPDAFKLQPSAYRYEGYYCNKRPVFHAKYWADRILEVQRDVIVTVDRRISFLDEKYLWKNCWPSWSEWLLDGVR